jgi:8-hydroxy-5-deazaflavin:NADPH oxidoreductase
VKIGIIGSGMIGSTCARLFVRAGHEVAIANSRGPGSLGDLVKELGPKARAATVEAAVESSEVVLAAIPLKAHGDLPASKLAGKIVIDAMNYYPGRDGNLDFGGRGSSGWLASTWPGAKVVKAFNTMYFKPLGEQGQPGAPLDDRLALFVAGDDAAAKRVVMDLIDQIGFAAVDTGSLTQGGLRQEPGTPIYNRPMRAPEARRALGA